MKHSKYSVTDIIFTVPTFLIFSMVVLVPLFISFFTAFTSWNGVSGNMKWVGFANFIELMDRESTSWTAMIFSFKFSFVCVILSNLIALLLALILTSRMNPTVADGLRVVFFLPNLVGGLILGFIWRFLFMNVVPSIGEVLNLQVFLLPWLGTPETGFWASVIVFLWRNIGYILLIYISGLNSIEKSILESATIDGANQLMIVLKMKLPLIVPAITSCLFLIISRAFKLFDIIFSLTGGGPYGSTQPYAYEIYSEAFQRNNYGLGSAKSIVFFILVASISLFQVYLTKRKEIVYD